jgi:hypothetical protein
MIRQLTAEGIGTCLVNFLTFSANPAEIKSWRREFIITILHQNADKGEGRSALPMSISTDRQKALQSSFIARLYYVGMHDREERITDAYDKTFGWIFADQDVGTEGWSDFRAWLRADTPLC